MSLDKLSWVLEQNRFDHILYFWLNDDIKINWDNFDEHRLYDHFSNFGQYERGRCMGYYSEKEIVN